MIKLTVGDDDGREYISRIKNYLYLLSRYFFRNKVNCVYDRNPCLVARYKSWRMEKVSCFELCISLFRVLNAVEKLAICLK